MLKHFLILTLVLLPFIGVSQSAEIDYRNQIKLSAFRTINILNPGVEISYERLFSNKLSTSISAGLATNTLGPFKKLRGYNIGLEEKYFLMKTIKRGKYFSLAFNHSDIKYQDEISGTDITSSLIIIDTFTIARKTTSISFKYGIQYYKKHFVLDINLGAGLKYRNVKHYDRRFYYPETREIFDLHHAANIEGAYFAFYLPLDIQLGYRF